METLLTLYPDVNDLLGLSSEDLAPVLLKHAAAMEQNGMFHPPSVNQQTTTPPLTSTTTAAYPFTHRQRIDVSLAEAWAWIQQQGLIAPASGLNGSAGWMIFTRKGREISNAADLAKMREAADFPKALIHPAIREKTYRQLMNNDLHGAAMAAFIAVEEAVRGAANFGQDKYGVTLMRVAFHPDTGPLREPSHPAGERDGLMNLFAGAIGSYKNAHSHRTSALKDLKDAQEQVVLASHLLRIVDARRR